MNVYYLYPIHAICSANLIILDLIIPIIISSDKEIRIIEMAGTYFAPSQVDQEDGQTTPNPRDCFFYSFTLPIV